MRVCNFFGYTKNTGEMLFKFRMEWNPHPLCYRISACFVLEFKFSQITLRTHCWQVFNHIVLCSSLFWYSKDVSILTFFSFSFIVSVSTIFCKLNGYGSKKWWPVMEARNMHDKMMLIRWWNCSIFVSFPLSLVLLLYNVPVLHSFLVFIEMAAFIISIL